MKKTIFFPLLVFIMLVSVFGVFNRYIYEKKQRDNSSVEPYTGTLEGTIVCLPYTIQDGPQTMECAFGLTTISGESYALDFSTNSIDLPSITVGEQIYAKGHITPIEYISSDQWKKYNIDGIFSIATFTVIPKAD